MGVRAYSPMLGRFMSADPLTIHGVAGDINPYGYVGGSVLNMIDPSGLDGWCIGVCETGGNGDGSSNRDGSGPGRDAAGPPPNSGGGSSSAGGGGNSRTPASRAPTTTYSPSPAPASGTAGGFVAGLRSAAAAALPTLLWLEDHGVLMHSQAAIMGTVGAVPLTPMPGGPKFGAVFDAFGIKADHRARMTQVVAGALGPMAFMGIAAAAERVAEKLATAAAEAGGEAAAYATEYLYRGVHVGHPALPDALAGRVVPGNPAGTITPELHNDGNWAGQSPFTSWTRSVEVAKFHAGKAGAGGVILRVPQGAPPPGASWSWEWSPDEYGEQEVLMRGIREGVQVFRW